MLCNSKNNFRPDKILQKALLKLTLALILLTFSLTWFFLYPNHNLYSTITTSLITIYCLFTAIKTLNAGEAAISYGGFANEIMRNDENSLRIENPKGENIIQNTSAKKLLKSESAYSFISKHIAESKNNNVSLNRLKNALKNLSSEKVIISLNLKSESETFHNTIDFFEISVHPIYLKKPQIFDGAFSVKHIRKETYFYWSFKNITAQKNMDKIFKDESLYLHDFLDYMPVGLYTVDKDYIINYANHDFAKFLNIPPQQLQGLSLKSFLTEDTQISLKHDFWKGTVHFIKATGETSETFICQNSYRQNEQTYFKGVVIHGLPTPAELQQQINKSLDEINWFFNNSPFGIIFINESGTIKNYNSKAQELFNISASAANLFSLLPEESLKTLQQNIIKAKEDFSTLNFELKTANKTLSIHFNALHHMHQKTSDNQTAFIIYATDATKQKNLEMQFSQAQKLQAVGQLAGGVAHDFNNLLTAMIGFTDLLLQRHGVGDPSFADLIQIKQNANRATALVRQLLAFSRKQPLLPKLIDITDSFADLSQMLKRILGEKIKLEINHGNDLGYVKVDPNQFSQVIINLAVNAKDAMNNQGKLIISTYTSRIAEKFTFGEDTITPGEFVVIDVTDTGCGIPQENLNRIFDPFFSTKENIVGSGTGLGLAMVYGIVRQTEGFIKVSSVVGKGTTFSIYLPRFEQGEETDNFNLQNSTITDNSVTPILKIRETISAPANINQKIIMGLNISNTIDRSHGVSTKDNRTPRILFVEDDDSVRSFGIIALKKKGYDVVESVSAENALEIFAQDPNFDLLLTDMVLPGMSGAQLTQQIKKQRPEIKVILASGYSEDIARQEIDNTTEFEFITKPYSLGDLTAKVFDVLNRPDHD